MARPLRFVPQGTLVEITCRTVQGRFLLLPVAGWREVFIGALARAQRLYPVRLHAFCCLSNHFHLLVSPTDARQLADFMRHLLTNLSKEAGRLHGWRGPLFERRYRAILVSDEKLAQLARLRYLLAHGVKEGLVARVDQWPGPHAGPVLRSGSMTVQGVWYDRSREYAARTAGRDFHPNDFATVYELRLEPLPCYPGDPDRQARFVARAIAEIERDAATRHLTGGTRPLGVRNILRQKPDHRPARVKWSAAPWVHAASKKARWQLYRAYGHFLAAYRAAADLLRSGRADVVFPDGSFPPPLPFVASASP